jgi:hypothetical protein
MIWKLNLYLSNWHPECLPDNDAYVVHGGQQGFIGLEMDAKHTYMYPYLQWVKEKGQIH